MKLQIGDILRLISPPVRDFIAGLAAIAREPQPQLVQSPTSEDDLGIDPGQSPPSATKFDMNGLAVSAAGDLARLAAALGHRSVRSFMLGLAAAAPEGSDRLAAVANMAAALVDAANGSELGRAQFYDVWADLFRSVRRRAVVTSTTNGAERICVDCFKQPPDGSYLADAKVILVASELGGSLRIKSTAITNRLLRSDRVLAQLDPQLVGVNARFVLREQGLAIEFTGVSNFMIDWTAYVTVLPQKRKRRGK